MLLIQLPPHLQRAEKTYNDEKYNHTRHTQNDLVLYEYFRA